jgi:hypothetical protein
MFMWPSLHCQIAPKHACGRPAGQSVRGRHCDVLKFGDKGSKSLPQCDLLGIDFEDRFPVRLRAAAIPILQQVRHQNADFAPLTAERLLRCLAKIGSERSGLA